MSFFGSCTFSSLLACDIAKQCLFLHLLHSVLVLSLGFLSSLDIPCSFSTSTSYSLSIFRLLGVASATSANWLSYSEVPLVPAGICPSHTLSQQSESDVKNVTHHVQTLAHLGFKLKLKNKIFRHSLLSGYRTLSL